MHILIARVERILKLLDPMIWRHLASTSCLPPLFTFRWLLVLFKREFPMLDVSTLWECLWAWELEWGDISLIIGFVAVAIIKEYGTGGVERLNGGDEVLKVKKQLTFFSRSSFFYLFFFLFLHKVRIYIKIYFIISLTLCITL